MFTIAQSDMERLSYWQSYNLFRCQIHLSLLKLHRRTIENSSGLNDKCLWCFMFGLVWPSALISELVTKRSKCCRFFFKMFHFRLLNEDWTCRLTEVCVLSPGQMCVLSRRWSLWPRCSRVSRASRGWLKPGNRDARDSRGAWATRGGGSDIHTSKTLTAQASLCNNILSVW